MLSLPGGTWGGSKETALTQAGWGRTSTAQLLDEYIMYICMCEGWLQLSSYWMNALIMCMYVYQLSCCNIINHNKELLPRKTFQHNGQNLQSTEYILSMEKTTKIQSIIYLLSMLIIQIKCSKIRWEESVIYEKVFREGKV